MVERGRARWTVRIAAAAEADLDGIVAWTREQFGPVQARIYAETVSLAVEALIDGPAQPGVKARPEIGKQLFTLHVARRGRKGRHFVLFRTDSNSDQHQIDVLRILHDSMDLERHAPEDD